jgi:hypothetical protein
VGLASSGASSPSVNALHCGRFYPAICWTPSMLCADTGRWTYSITARRTTFGELLMHLNGLTISGRWMAI